MSGGSNCLSSGTRVDSKLLGRDQAGSLLADSGYLGKAQPGVSDKTRIEVRLWASMRSQTVMRTVQGAVPWPHGTRGRENEYSKEDKIAKKICLYNFGRFFVGSCGKVKEPKCLDVGFYLFRW